MLRGSQDRNVKHFFNFDLMTRLAVFPPISLPGNHDSPLDSPHRVVRGAAGVFLPLLCALHLLPLSMPVPQEASQRQKGKPRYARRSPYSYGDRSSVELPS